MVQEVRSRVDFTSHNVSRCLCPECPVQGKSQCVASQKKEITKALKKNPLKREEIPAVYCSTGTATCSELDFTESCICGSCSVFDEYNLVQGQPVLYYCRDGSSK